MDVTEKKEDYCESLNLPKPDNGPLYERSSGLPSQNGTTW